MKTMQISRTVLQSLYGDCTEAMTEVFSQFLRSHTEIRESLVTSYNSGCVESLKKFLHYHGPSFMYLGMPVVSDCFKNLEEQCKQNSDRMSISSGFTKLMQFVDQSKLIVLNELEYIKKAA